MNDSRKIAPVGWHVPSDAEWQRLVDQLGGSSVAGGGKLKEAGTAHWNSPNTGADHSSGFSALPGGYRYFGDGHYCPMGSYATFWSSTECDYSNAWYRSLSYDTSGVNRGLGSKQSGFSVRCVRD